MNDRLSAEEALREIDQIGGSVRRSGRWASRWMLVLGIGAVVYWLAMLLGGETLRDIAGWGWLVFVACSVIYVFRQRVFSRAVWRLQWPVAAGFVLTSAAATLFAAFLMPDEPGPLRIPLAVLIAVVAGAPPIWGGWLLRHREVAG
ncbi:threonine/serine exporter family protein [Spongiactinospora rosea]|uniref:threonine/serine exporter family protein n=1 Tax=Spongiactinospora rosea TaxID=2248750 RepID=UPI00131483D5|nr:threonine/serine exporter family protein [Spongiactinospora rosea]